MDNKKTYQWEQGDMYDFGDVCPVCGWDSGQEPCRLAECPNCGAKFDIPYPVERVCATCGAYDPDLGVCNHDKSPVMQTGPDNTCPFWWSAE